MRVGDIYWVYTTDIYPPKKKLGLCVCVEENWFFFINSENRIMYDCVPMPKVGHAFLKHDSYVSCSRKFSFQKSNLEAKAGQASRKLLQQILGRVQVSEVLEQDAINKISCSLEAALQ